MKEYVKSFADEVFDGFGELRRTHRFVPVWTAGTDFAALLRKEAEDVFVSVIVRDNRSRGGDLIVSLWIAPPESPSDALDNLYVGYKVRIASEYDVDDEYLLRSQKRIVRFLPCIPPMVPVIRAELEAPAFRTRRWTAYRLEREVLVALLCAADEGDDAAVAALSLARRAARGKGSFRRIEKACVEATTRLLQQGVLSEAVVRFYNGDPANVAFGLNSHLYAHALGELSAEKAKKG